MKKNIRATIGMFLVFVIYTILVKVVDVEAIGPEGSSVGFASLNGKVFELTGFSDFWYNLSKILGIAMYAMVGVFAVIGIVQLIKRKSLAKVDKDLYVLAVFYVAVAVFYVLFDKVIVINYRPVIFDKGLEVSYPSTHAFLAVTLLCTAAEQFNRRIKKENLRMLASNLCIIVMSIIVLGRVLAGCHWLTDIIGGILLGSTLILAYVTAVSYFCKNVQEMSEQND